MNVATQTAPDRPVKGNIGSGDAGSRQGYGGNGKAVARYSNGCGKSLTGYGNVDYRKGVASYNDAGYGGKGLAGCSSGSHTYNTSTPTGGESNKACAKVYNCPKCKNTFFPTTQAQGGHITHHHRIMEKKGKAKLDTQCVPHKCRVFNHVCQTGQELSFHMMRVCTLTLALLLLWLRKKTFEATGINIIGATLDGPFNTMGGEFQLEAPSSHFLR